MVYYYFVCPRKLWYFSHDIQLEQTSELVQIGKIIDENTFQQDEKHIDIDGVINIDFLRSKHIIHEVKKSKAIEEAGIWQVKYYLYYLAARGVTGLTGRIHYPMLKETIQVQLSDNNDIVELEQALRRITQLICEDVPPSCSSKRICTKCAYRDFCFI